MTSTLESLINKLTTTFVTKGVQPSELADAIFDDSYLSIENYKINDFIHFIISYEVEGDEISPKSSIHRMKYIYDQNRYLIRIEQMVNNKNYKIIWDRNICLESLVLQIAELFPAYLSKNQFFDNLPSELKNITKNNIKLVA